MFFEKYEFDNLIISRGAEGPGREILQRPPSVRPSVCLYCNSKTHWCIFQCVHHVMGMCCIVFHIDGMLFEFFMNFLNIEKKKKLNIFFFSIFHVFFAFHAISNITKKNLVKKNSTILSHFMFYAIFNIKKNIETPPRLSVRPSVRHV